MLSHLPPATLSAISLVSHRFHDLVTTPHAWRTAFSRRFPGPDNCEKWNAPLEASRNDSEAVRSEKRVFTRLTALASWRSEYILRTRLLSSLSRGKPAQFQGAVAAGTSRSGFGSSGNAQISYDSYLASPINHLHASYGKGLNKRIPRFIHGADEVGEACSSEPANGKVDKWGFQDPRSFLQFEDRFPGDARYGLGSGNVIGVPNSMDVSQTYGMVYAEGLPAGSIYFRSMEEQRGRFLALPSSSVPELGIPKLVRLSETICSVWIAKDENIPTLSDGLFGIISGSSNGTVTSYSLGTNSLQERRLERGEITARWVLSPGVPIISIAVDEALSSKRLAKQRVCIVILNALGEVFYLTALPTRPEINRSIKLSEQGLEQLAWKTGRSVYWDLIDPTRRIARPDPFGPTTVKGSYSPRSSWDGLGLSSQQIVSETREIERFVGQQPKYFQMHCEGWDMQRRLEVDFAGDDGSGAGEGVFVFNCGVDELSSVGIRRFTRCMILQTGKSSAIFDECKDALASKNYLPKASIFGGEPASKDPPTWSFSDVKPTRRNSTDSPQADAFIGEWRTSEFSFGGLKSTGISTTAIDRSIYSYLLTSEDPLLGMAGSSTASSPASSPLGNMPKPTSPSEIPGQRARFLAAGTKAGTVLLWNMRDRTPSNSSLVNTVGPVSIIHTDSPQISCLAISALYLVHGGSDGLVQAWDPLYSTAQPIRTLNSRFSSRVRRRIAQAALTPQGVGTNFFAAGAVCLDPDPTCLRGMVSLGTHLRYWSYSSSTADQYKGSKRKLRRSERGSNQGGGDQRFTGSSRGALKDYIANEKLELEREKADKQKEEARLAGRFGINLLGPGASEDEILAYATLLSEEAAKSDEQRRKNEMGGGDEGSSRKKEVAADDDICATEIDHEIEEAIRLSLLEAENQGLHPTAEGNQSLSASQIRSQSASPSDRSGNGQDDRNALALEEADLDLALRLSVAEQNSRGKEGEFPPLGPDPADPTGSGSVGSSKGKGKMRAE